MSPVKMHVDEQDTDPSLVRRLIGAQFPQWADLPVEPVHSAGTDNALYRLGDDKVVRLPRIPSAVGQVEKEHEWLPRLGPLLPLAVPVPLGKGSPGEGYPWHWSVYRWLEGQKAAVEGMADSDHAAKDLARFITALHRIDPTDGPVPGPHNSFRGVPLRTRDSATRAAIDTLRDMVDVRAATAAWEAALQAPAWRGAPVWIHGDLQPGNLLTRNGRLCAVIDFGCLGVGDPACDLAVAWNLLSTRAREGFRRELAIDEAIWARGRGWALSIGLIALPYYYKTNPSLAAISRYTIDQVLGDQRDTAAP
jgi:aminoglycoside phosphotransferase (APT) family kinase protein